MKNLKKWKNWGMLFLLLGQMIVSPAITLADTVNTVPQQEQSSDQVKQTTSSSSKVKETETTIETEKDVITSNSSDQQEDAKANDSPEIVTDEMKKELAKQPYIGSDGYLYVDGERKVFADGQVPEEYQELYKQGATRKFRASIGGATIEYLGTITWGYHTVGSFKVNGKVAFCLQHPKGTPASNTPNNGLEPLDNKKIQIVLYYGYGGTKDISPNATEGIVATSLALSHYYYGDSYNSLPTMYNTLLNYAETKNIPSHKIQINQSNALVNLAVTYDGKKQKTTSATFNADKTNQISVAIPSGITYVCETTGATATNKTVKIYGGQKFHLEAGATVGTSFNSGVKKSAIKEFQPLVVKPVSSGLQTLGTWRWYDDPAQVVSFKADFKVRSGSADIQKVDKVTNQALAGAKFHVVIGSDSYDLTSGTDGKVKIPKDYQDGTTGTVTEVQAPNGYVLDTTAHTFTFKAGQTVTVSITDQAQMGVIKIDKTISGYGKELPNGNYSLKGNVFEVKDATGNVVDTLTTDKDGNAQSKELPLGKYSIKETKASNGLVLNPTEYAAELTYAGQEVAVTDTTVSIENKAVRGNATLVKRDSETNDTPQGDTTFVGAKFELQEKVGSSWKQVGIYTTDKKGALAVKGLLLGDYQWIERKAPTGYVLDETPIPFSLTYKDQNSETVVANSTAKDHVAKGAFDITKYGTYDWLTTAWNWITGNKPAAHPLLKGAEFTVTRTFGDKGVEQVQTTNAKGYAKFTNLPYGKYTVSETKTPTGYKPVSDFTVTITEDGQSFHYSLEDKVKEAHVRVVKVDTETGKAIKLAKAGFEVYSKTTGKKLVMKDSDGKEISTFYTDKEGVLQFPTLFAFGKYSLKEVVAPEGYTLAKDAVDFEVTGDEPEAFVKLTFTDVAQKGQVHLHKDVQTPTDVTEEETQYGKVTHVTYTPQSGYGFEFKIRATEDITTADGTVRLKKGEFVQKEGKDLVLRTDIDGNASSTPELYLGQYEMVETQAPAGALLRDPQAFEITYAEQDVDVTSKDVQMTDETQQVTIIGHKQEEAVKAYTKNLLETNKQAANGQVFALRNAEDQTIGSNTIAKDSTFAYCVVKDGEFSWTGYLPEGNYYVQEVDAGSHHVLDPAKHAFTYKALDNESEQVIDVFANGTTINGEQKTRKTLVPIVNELFKTDISFKKLNENHKLTPNKGYAFDFSDLGKGAEFTLKNEDNHVIQTLTIGDNGIGTWKDLVVGTYYMNETKSSDATHLLDKGTYKIVVTKEVTTAYDPFGNVLATQENKAGKETTDSQKLNSTRTKEGQEQEDGQVVPLFVLKNAEKKGEAFLVKSDEATKKVLAGATIKLVDSKGETVAQGVTGKDGVFHLPTKLPVGTYQFIEVKAPTGYILDPTPKSFEVKEDQQQIAINMTNKAQPKKVLPQTGEKVRFQTFLTLLGITLIACVAVGLWVFKRAK